MTLSSDPIHASTLSPGERLISEVSGLSLHVKFVPHVRPVPSFGGETEDEPLTREGDGILSLTTHRFVASWPSHSGKRSYHLSSSSIVAYYGFPQLDWEEMHLFGKRFHEYQAQAKVFLPAGLCLHVELRYKGSEDRSSEQYLKYYERAQRLSALLAQASSLLRQPVDNEGTHAAIMDYEEAERRRRED